jgi:hypothetical protein
MTSKRTADTLILLTRNLDPYACQLGHIVLTHDETLPSNIRAGLIDTLLTVTPAEPITKLGEVVAELIIILKMTPKPNGTRARVAELFDDIRRMESMSAVGALLIWWATIKNVLDEDDTLSVPVLH